MKRITLFIICALAAACDKVHEGVVVGKRYEAPREYQTSYTTVSFIGKIPITQFHYYTAYDDEDFILTIKAETKDKVILKDFYVSKQVYDCIKVGNWFNDTIPCEKDDTDKEITNE